MARERHQSLAQRPEPLRRPPRVEYGSAFLDRFDNANGLDGLRIDLQRIPVEDDKIGEFPGLERPFGALFLDLPRRMIGDCQQALIGRQSLLRSGAPDQGTEQRAEREYLQARRSEILQLHVCAAGASRERRRGDG